MQEALENLYGVATGLKVEDFLIDAEMLGELRDMGIMTSHCSRPDEQLLVIEGENQMEMALFLDEDLLATMADRHRPDQVDHLCLIAEGVSHFVYLAWRARHLLPVTLLELEVQGEVDKYLTCVMPWAGKVMSGAPGAQQTAGELRNRLFDNYRLTPGLDEHERERYRLANRLAARYCEYLERRFLTSPEGAIIDAEVETDGWPNQNEMVDDLRRFYRMGQNSKLSYINQLN